MFAVVDIETTGSHASSNRITEIAVVLFDGIQIEGKFNSLVNPMMPIQKYVQSLTGITDKMVANEKPFSDIAPHVYNLLKDRIFVAHNVNFDYSFIHHQLQVEGFQLNVPKLCTIRLARKIFPGLRKYGLENICRELNIENNNRHRATGDAVATTQLLSMLITHDKTGEIAKMTKGRNAHQHLPPNLTKELVDELPSEPGVYYFYNQAGKIVYVGKAKNLKKRVSSHFSNNKITKQKQLFLREVYSINYKICSSEFTAALLESIEIKRLWPLYNKSQKSFERAYGIYCFEDARGYLRLAIDNKRKYLTPLLKFSLIADANRTLWKYVKDFGLHPTLCFLDQTPIEPNEFPEMMAYNQLVNNAIDAMNEQKTNCLIHDGFTDYILIEQGSFYGIGTIEIDKETFRKVEDVKHHFTPYPENETLRTMLRKYVEKFPSRVMVLED